jgi:hypothetical protein
MAKVSKEVSKYMAMIGARGGKKSKGTLTSERARELARIKKLKRETIDKEKEVE